MLLTNFTFDELSHKYMVPGHRVLSTSEVISLCGLSDYSQIPAGVLANASWRGVQFHRAVEFVESAVAAGSSLRNASIDMISQLHGPLEEIKGFLIGYLKFRQDYDIEPIPPGEKQLVYLHNNVAIGCTIDLRCRIHGRGFKGIPAIGDFKSNAKMYGKALEQKRFAWRLQLQSYKTATGYDTEFWSNFGDSAEECSRFICQTDKHGEYTMHCFRDFDDAKAWDSAVTLAAAKLQNGYKLDDEKAA